MLVPGDFTLFFGWITGLKYALLMMTRVDFFIRGRKMRRVVGWNENECRARTTLVLWAFLAIFVRGCVHVCVRSSSNVAARYQYPLSTRCSLNKSTYFPRVVDKPAEHAYTVHPPTR